MVSVSPFFMVMPPAVMVCVAIVDAQRAGAGDAGLAHAARDDSRVRRHAAARRQNAFGGMHAVNVFRRGLDADQDHLAALTFQQLRFLGREHDFAGRRAGRGRQAGGDDLALGIGIDGRMQQLVERARDRSAPPLLPW